MKHLHPLCSRCVYWEQETNTAMATAGHCHRYPPGIYVNPKTGTVIQKFPTTDQHHWCGEWEGDESRLMEGVRHSATESFGTP